MKRITLIIINVILIFNINAQISFVDQATNLGLGSACGTTYLGNGITFYDFDNDGWDDITLNTESGQSIDGLHFLNLLGLVGCKPGCLRSPKNSRCYSSIGLFLKRFALECYM